MLAVMRNPKIHIISHPGDGTAEMDFVPLILSSDAHISFQIADYSRIMPLVEEVGFPDELIINYWPEKFFQYLGIG